MPILMIALLALAVFAGIGVLLAAAVILESKTKIGKHLPEVDSRATPLVKH
jgi:hypothetical protein